LKPRIPEAYPACSIIRNAVQAVACLVLGSTNQWSEFVTPRRFEKTQQAWRPPVRWSARSAAKRGAFFSICLFFYCKYIYG